MKKKMALTAAAVALVGTLAVGGTLAWFTDTETATNVVTTGNVDVKITENMPTEEQQNAGKYTATENENEGITYEGIEPGTVIQKDPVIQYIGVSKAYVRYKVVVEGIDWDNVEFWRDDVNVTEDIKGLVNGDWQYSTEIYETGDFVTHGGTVKDVQELFTEVKFKGGNELADKKNINITIKADAIQADNLPDVNNDGEIGVDDIKAAFDEGVVSYKDDKTVYEQ